MKTISMWKNVGQFTPPPPPEIAREDLPLKLSIQFTPPEIGFISTFLPHKSDIN